MALNTQSRWFSWPTAPRLEFILCAFSSGASPSYTAASKTTFNLFPVLANSSDTAPISVRPREVFAVVGHALVVETRTLHELEDQAEYFRMETHDGGRGTIHVLEGIFGRCG